MRTLVVVCSLALSAEAQEGVPEGFTPLWNGRDLAGWHGRGHSDPEEFAARSGDERQRMLAEGTAAMRKHWAVQDGAIVNDGEGPYLTTDRDYGDIELLLEYRTVPLADSGIYLRGTPQVQIWDTRKEGGKWEHGADKGSGGLWNNRVHERFPLVHADRPFGEWNSMRILQVGERTSVWLNDEQVVDWTVMENYWDRSRPLYPRGPIQLQTHGGEIRFRNLFVRELPPAEANRLLMQKDVEGFEPVFDGRSFEGWSGDLDSYEIEDGAIRCRPGSGGNLFTEQVYGDFAVRLLFRLPAGGNNGLAIRYSGEGSPAHDALEIQVLDDTAEKYSDLEPWQYHGSVYGLVPSRRGYLRPVGEWNFEEVVVRGSCVTVSLNGTTVLDADLAAIEEPMDGRAHPGRSRTEGHFGFCGHRDPVEFKDIRIKRL